MPDVCAIGAMYPEWLEYGAGRHELPRGARPADRHEGHAVRPARRHDHGRRLLELQADQELRRRLLPRQRRGVDRALLVRRQLAEAPVRGGRPTRSTRSSRTTASTPGSRRRASRASPCRSGPLAQVLVGYVGGHEPTKRWADLALETVVGDREDAGHAGDAALDARPPRGARDPHRGDRRAGAEALAAAGRQHRQGRHDDLQRARRSRAARSAASASTRRRAARSRTGP